MATFLMGLDMVKRVVGDGLVEVVMSVWIGMGC